MPDDLQAKHDGSSQTFSGKPGLAPITLLEATMGRDTDGRVTPFDRQDKNRDGFLDTTDEKARKKAG